MHIRRQDRSILLVYYLGYSAFRNLRFRLDRKPIARFVTFHDLPDEAVAGFRRKLIFLKRRMNVISMDDYFGGKLSSRKINVVITFDDGYKSWVRRAVPILEELEMAATFFVSSGFVGLSQEDEDEFVRSKLKTPRKTTGGLCDEDLKELAGRNFTIGGHTFNHVNLGEIEDRSHAKREIFEDKQKLGAIIGKEIEYFAYPFGECCGPQPHLTSLLREAGYKGAVTLIPGFNTKETNRYSLFRELTSADIRLCLFRAQVFGAYDGVNALRNSLGLKCYPTA